MEGFHAIVLSLARDEAERFMEFASTMGRRRLQGYINIQERMPEGMPYGWLGEFSTEDDTDMDRSGESKTWFQNMKNNFFSARNIIVLS